MKKTILILLYLILLTILCGCAAGPPLPPFTPIVDIPEDHALIYAYRHENDNGWAASAMGFQLKVGRSEATLLGGEHHVFLVKPGIDSVKYSPRPFVFLEWDFVPFESVNHLEPGKTYYMEIGLDNVKSPFNVHFVPESVGKPKIAETGFRQAVYRRVPGNPAYTDLSSTNMVTIYINRSDSFVGSAVKHDILAFNYDDSSYAFYSMPKCGFFKAELPPGEIGIMSCGTFLREPPPGVVRIMTFAENLNWPNHESDLSTLAAYRFHGKAGHTYFMEYDSGDILFLNLRNLTQTGKMASNCRSKKLSDSLSAAGLAAEVEKLPPAIPLKYANRTSIKQLLKSKKKIGLVWMIPPQARYYQGGDQGGLIDILVTEASTSAMQAWLNNFKISQEVADHYITLFSNAFKHKGLTVIAGPKSMAPNSLTKTTQPGPLKHDLSNIAREIGVDYLLVLDIKKFGIIRGHLGFITLTEPHGLVKMDAFMVDASTNRMLMYHPITSWAKTEGAWDTPPEYQGLKEAISNAFEQAVDMAYVTIFQEKP